MAYQKTHWQDHAVERPRTFTSVTNEDGSRTDVPSPGEILQQGTPMSATNFNNIENGLMHASIALDWLTSIVQAQARQITTMNEQIALLSETET